MNPRDKDLMMDRGKDYGIIAETYLEARIQKFSIYYLGFQTKKVGDGLNHPESALGHHIVNILAFIDRQPWEEYRRHLRLLAMLHDIGKVYVIRAASRTRPEGVVVGEGHSKISADLTANFFGFPQALVMIIRIHDKYFHFYNDDKRGKFKQAKFMNTFGDIDLDLLIRFNYADSCNRERDSVRWFEDKCVELGLRENKLYELEPSVLS